MSDMSTSSVPAQLRRRREASYRCPPLDSGVRDPIVEVRTRTSSKPATVTSHNSKAVLVVNGPGVVDVLRAARLKPIYSGAVRGFLLDLRHMADVVAHLEHAGYRVRVEEAR